MQINIQSHFQKNKTALLSFIINFNSTGTLFADGKRNKIKLFLLEDKLINIKSFKIPNFLNKIVYGYFRKSKARRSFEYGSKLISLGIGTPDPIGFVENSNILGLKDSYYVSEHLQCDLTYRELVEISDYPDRDKILRQFTQFSYRLHKKGIEFKDHSPGNTLIIKNEIGNYEFYLVDLNRMAFHDAMPFEMRMKNLCRLTPHKEMVAIMSNEYAKLSGESEEVVFQSLWKMTSDFQYRYYRKKRIKKKFKFW